MANLFVSKRLKGCSVRVDGVTEGGASATVVNGDRRCSRVQSAARMNVTAVELAKAELVAIRSLGVTTPRRLHQVAFLRSLTAPAAELLSQLN